MSYRKINNIVGWIVGIIACVVFISTMEPRGSFWDCGEFASSAFKLQIPHAPGAPLFLIIAKVFTLFMPGNPAGGVNLLSAVSSGLTVMFLFWSITHFARKIVVGSNLSEPVGWQNIAIMASGAIGAFAYCFSDSQWFSAVEAEVYALSSFFTAVVFWAILKWEHNYDNYINNVDKEHAAHPDRWIVFIFFMMGLSIGVHLLNLLTIPAILMVVYYKRYEQHVKKNSMTMVLFYLFAAMVSFALSFIVFGFSLLLALFAGAALTVGFGILFKDEKNKLFYSGSMLGLLVGIILTGLIQKFVIQSTIDMAGGFEVVFKNSFGLPFFTGFIVFFVLLGILIFIGFRYARKKGFATLNLALWCTVFMLLGYSSYITTLVRSNANPSINMYAVNNPYALKGYLSREQYGDWPIVYGQKFTAKPEKQTLKYSYQKSGDSYIKIQNGVDNIYAPEDKMLFVRTWDSGDEQGHATYYKNVLGLVDENGEERDVNYSDQSRFFYTYQMNWMYWRYFMWNFAGKQNDNQGFYNAVKSDGNWKSGVKIIDNLRLGDQDLLPDTLKENKANNKLYFLPLILGIIGVLYQFKQNKRDAIVNTLLFFFTGIAIVIYLNQAGNQPRERDYAFVGSFYAFSIFIGLGVLQVIEWARKYIANAKAATLAASALCTLAVPILMAVQEWDDHDRSKKTLALASAKAYLESCPPNAILFTYGDNDTYPLWYAQEIEDIRTDIRIINTSLLGTGWYVNLQRLAVNKSAPIDMLSKAEQVEGDKLNVLYYDEKSQQLRGSIAPDSVVDISAFVKTMLDPASTLSGEDEDGNTYSQSFFNVQNYSIPVDANVVKSNGTVGVNDIVPDKINISMGNKRYLTLSDLALLDIIASNKWKRPICFSSLSNGIGLTNYLRKEGIVYRLTPQINSMVMGFTDYQNSIETLAKADTNFRPNLRSGWSIGEFNKLTAAQKAIVSAGMKKVWVISATQGMGVTWGVNGAFNKSIVLDKPKIESGGIDKNGIYLDEENRRHALGLRDVFAETAGYLADNGNMDEAKKVLDKCELLYPEKNMPYAMNSRFDLHYRSCLLYVEACYKAQHTTLLKKVVGKLTTDIKQMKAYLNDLKSANNESDLNSLQEVEDGLGIMEQVYGGK
jgi:MFS family permease